MWRGDAGFSVCLLSKTGCVSESGLTDGIGDSNVACMTKWEGLQQHSDVQPGSITRVVTLNSVR